MKISVVRLAQLSPAIVPVSAQMVPCTTPPGLVNGCGARPEINACMVLFQTCDAARLVVPIVGALSNVPSQTPTTALVVKPNVHRSRLSLLVPDFAAT